MEDADLFLDDDLGSIANDKLLELEQNAISATQRIPSAATKSQSIAQHRLRGQDNVSGLVKSRAANTPWRPPQHRLPPQSQRPNSDPDPPSQQIDYADESVINLAEQPLPGWSQSQALPQRSAAAHGLQTKGSTAIDPETAAAYAAADAELFGGADQPTTISDNATSLQARIAMLEAEASRARHAESQAQKMLESKSGEITIVRANLERQKKEHDRRMSALQQEHAIQAAKHKAELESGRKEREKMQTDNRFLQHDLNQEAERLKRLNGPGRPRTAQLDRETPKKNRRQGQGDGFDDSEVLYVSPSKSKERLKDTPKAGSKRKRAAPDSPIAPLSFVKPSPLREESTETTAFQAMPTSTSNVSNAVEKDRLRFVQTFLSYHPEGAQSRALDLLMRYEMPSSPGISLSSELLELLPIAGGLHPEPVSVQTCRILLRMWKRCLQEQYYLPHTLLVDLIGFCLSTELPSKYNTLAEDLVPLCLKSLELVTLPVVRAALGKTYNNAVYMAQHASLSSQIDASQVTDLLSQLCEACTLASERIEAFWRSVDFTNSMLLIHKALPMARVMVGLDMLTTSALETSFGTINADPTVQEKQESDGIYRLTFAFFDIPTIPNGEEPYSQAEIAEFRLSLLQVFQKMCHSEHNSRMLASNVHFLGKLIRFIEEQISRLYSLCASRSQFPIDSDDEKTTPDAHDLVATTINISVRILYHLLSKHDEGLNLGDKFNVVIGGYHKFLIGMTRIAFAEQGSICEYGIEEDVIDAAHSILDQWLTPDDGEAIAKAFETPQGTRGMSARKTVNRPPQHDMMEVDGASPAPD